MSREAWKSAILDVMKEIIAEKKAIGLKTDAPIYGIGEGFDCDDNSLGLTEFSRIGGIRYRYNEECMEVGV